MNERKESEGGKRGRERQDRERERECVKEGGKDRGRGRGSMLPHLPTCRGLMKLYQSDAERGE